MAIDYTKEYYFVFGALLAITLSLLWVGTTLWFVVIAITVENCNVGVNVSNVTSDGYQCPTSAFVEVHNVTFGLISATVVAQLAITSPGKSPSKHLTRMVNGTGETGISWIKWTPAFYVASWAVFGLLALIVGCLSRNAVVLRTTGFSFFGTAITATYAYFGIDPHKSKTDDASSENPAVVASAENPAVVPSAENSAVVPSAENPAVVPSAENP